MADGKARIEATLDGASRVAGEANRIQQAFTQVGAVFQSLSGNLDQMGANLHRTINEISAAATGIKSLDFNKAAGDAKNLDEAITKLAIRSNRGVSELRQQFESLSTKVLIPPDKLAAAASSLTRLSGDARGSIEAVGVLGQEAIKSARDLDELVPIGEGLARAFHTPLGQVKTEFELIRQVVKSFGGSEIGLQTLLSNLSPQLQGFATHSDDARKKLIGLVSELSKGRSLEKGQQIAGAALSYVQGNADNIARYTGETTPGKVLEDPAGALTRLIAKAKQGRGRAEQERVLFNEVHDQALVEAFLSLNPAALNRKVQAITPPPSAVAPTPKSLTHARGDADLSYRVQRGGLSAAGFGLLGAVENAPRSEADPRYLQTEAGKRRQIDAELGAAERAGGRAFLSSQDAYGRAFRGNAAGRFLGEKVISLLPETGQTFVRGAAAAAAGVSAARAPKAAGDAAYLGAEQKATVKAIDEGRTGLPPANSPEWGAIGRSMASEFRKEVSQNGVILKVEKDPNASPGGQ